MFCIWSGSHASHTLFIAFRQVYTAVEGLSDADAVGITDGPAYSHRYRQLEDAEIKAERECFFPMERSRRAFAIELQNAEASKLEDKKRILDAIAGGVSVAGEERASRYAELNGVLRGRFAAASLRAKPF